MTHREIVVDTQPPLNERIRKGQPFFIKVIGFNGLNDEIITPEQIRQRMVGGCGRIIQALFVDRGLQIYPHQDVLTDSTLGMGSETDLPEGTHLYPSQDHEGQLVWRGVSQSPSDKPSRIKATGGGYPSEIYNGFYAELFSKYADSKGALWSNPNRRVHNRPLNNFHQLLSIQLRDKQCPPDYLGIIKEVIGNQGGQGKQELESGIEAYFPPPIPQHVYTLLDSFDPKKAGYEPPRLIGYDENSGHFAVVSLSADKGLSQLKSPASGASLTEFYLTPPLENLIGRDEWSGMPGKFDMRPRQTLRKGDHPVTRSNLEPYLYASD